MDKIRVLLANSPIMVPDAVRRLVEEQDDMEVVGDCRGPMKILQETGRTKADAVILLQEGTDEAGLCSQLLVVYPDVVILSITPELTTAFTVQLASHRKKYVTTHQDELVQPLRAAIQRSRSIREC